ncbi:FlgO family outer membrane protein [Thermospira aquatica]|uniref:FlgO domain-containing protein n=1 Tax=Thermospira aquatica TaxID=2828656 RepID=A0AAX3BDK2_9SPIR|nr:FlgO family outer membrane protein [Thermospira aquatica]URA10340.1 hypothetical protein KDW03_00615 [Thermospira aquatica]
MKQKRFLGLLFIVLALTGSCSFVKRQPPRREQILQPLPLDLAVKTLVNQILHDTQKEENKKLAVLDFFDIEGKATPLGSYLAETITTKVFQTKKFEIIERRMLSKLIEEQKLSLIGFIDPETAQNIGKLIGASAIITGTVSDLGDFIRVNARLISTEKGTILGAASIDIIKDNTIKKLLSKETPIPPQETTRKEAQEETNISLAKIVVYVGDVPPGESGRSASGTEINVGGSIILTAQGRDGRGNWVPVNPTWQPTKPNIIEITPTTGPRVRVKGLAPGTVDIIVEFAGVKHTVELIFVR